MYFITVFEELPKINSAIMYIGSNHNVGFVKSFEVANDIVSNNYNDIWENKYTYCVIEYIEEGIKQPVLKRWFYKYNEDEDGYKEIDEPINFKNYHNFVIQ
jgi:hypothetical protein